MGAWSADTFGNDAACDWIGTFLDDPGLPTVKSAIDKVLDTRGYLDSYDASECLAACEVIARLQGRWGLRNSFSSDLDAWIEANPTEVPVELKAAADAAIERMRRPDSGMREVFRASRYYEEWIEAVDDLRARIQG